MRVTVAICTRNRCQLLSATLRTLAAVVVPPSLSLDVLVIDNGSTDGTPDALLQFVDLIPLRTLVEPRLGLSHARNAAIAYAHGEYLIWIDDDVLVDRDWLRAYHDAFRDWPDAAFFGGPIAPLFEGTPPAWMEEALPQIGNAYAALDLGNDSIELAGDGLPFGANMAIRADAQRQWPYDPALGRQGDELNAGEEWAVLESLLESGATGRWVPAARVRHVIPRERQSLDYLRRYYVGNGRSHARVRHRAGEALLVGRPRWAWREAVTQELAFQLSRHFAPPRVWSAHLRRASVAWGLLREPVSRKPDQNSDNSSDRG